MHRGVLPLRTKSGLPSRPQGVPTHPRVLSMSSLTRPARTASIVLRRPSRHPGRNRLSFPGPRLCRLPSLQPMGSLTAKPFPSPGPKLSMFLGLSRLLCPMLFRSLRTNRPSRPSPNRSRPSRPNPSRTLLRNPHPSRMSLRSPSRSRTLLRNPSRSRTLLRNPHQSRNQSHSSRQNPNRSRTLLHSPSRSGSSRPSPSRPSRTSRSRTLLRSPHPRRLKPPCQSPSRHLNRSPSRRPSQS